MRGHDAFGAWCAASTFFKHLEEEQERALQARRAFAVIRIEARRGVHTARELLLLYRTVAGALRRTDPVMPIGGRALAASLSDTEEGQAEAAVTRLRDVLATDGDRWRAITGWACISPGTGSWEEAWQAAGIRMLGDGAIPAAA